MGGKFERYVIPAVIGFAPAILFLLTWDAHDYTRFANSMRTTTATVLIAELFTIVVALRQGALGSWTRIKMPMPAFVAFIVLVVVAIFTAAVVAPHKGVALARTTYWIVHLLFGLSIAHLCGRQFGQKELVDSYLIGFVTLAMLFAIFSISVWQRGIRWTWDLPAFLHIRHVGIYATPMVGLAFGMMASEHRQRWLWALAVATTGFALSLWTGSRGPAISLAFAYLVGAFFLAELRLIKAWGGAVLSFIIAASAVWLLPTPANNMGLARTIAATTNASDVTTGRMQLWKIVLDAIGHSPLYGYGEGQMEAVATFYTMAQPHNLVLQVLLAWGAIGLTCVIVLAVLFVRRIIPTVGNDPRELAGPFLAMTALFALSMLDAALYHILPLSIFAACAGMISSSWIQNHSTPQ